MVDHKRKTHVYRVYQTDDDGNVVDDQVWIDLARLDLLPVSVGGDPSGREGQIVGYYWDWGDDISPVKGRAYRQLKIALPESLGGPSGSGGGGDASTFIYLGLIESARVSLGPNDDGTTGQRVKFVFKNQPDSDAQTARKATPVRVVNNDLNNAITWPVATVGQPPPATPQGGEIKWDDYASALRDGTTDDSQYVDVEVVDSFVVNFPSPSQSRQGVQGQRVKFKLKNDVVEKLFKAPPDSSDTVWRLDPLEVVVNVSWGGGLAAEFGDQAQDAPGDGLGGGGGA